MLAGRDRFQLDAPCWPVFKALGSTGKYWEKLRQTRLDYRWRGFYIGLESSEVLSGAVLDAVKQA